MADLKNLIKDARKFIDEKKYEDAQECCKKILKKDKDNYLGLVLLGKSLENSDKTPIAYQKAISLKRDQPLAWLGLAHYYETKHDDISLTKLLEIYNEVLYLQMEEDKTQEIILKLGQLGECTKNDEAIGILVNFINKTENSKLKKSAEKQILNLLKSDLPNKEQNLPILLGICKKSYLEDPDESLELILCRLILQSRNFIDALDELTNLPYFSRNSSVRDYTCKIICTKYVKNMSVMGLDIEKYIDLLTENIKHLKYPSLLQSIALYEKGLYLEAYKQCVPLLNYQDANAPEAVFIMKFTVNLKEWSVTETLVNNFLSKAKEEKLCLRLRKLLFLSLAKQYKWREAIATAKMINFNEFNIKEQACLAECFIEIDDLVNCNLENFKSTEYYLPLQASLLLKQNKHDEVVQLLSGAESPLCIFYLGKCYWDLKEFDKSYINLLKAAKLNPDHWEALLYLGHFYYYQKNDLGKARKCYEKAHGLNTVNMKVAKCLSETYIKLQLFEDNFKLLLKIAKKNSCIESWICFRLGLHYLNNRDCENAIVNFRNVIKSNKNDIIAFECLADAYYSRGSYNSAFKVYNKVIMMDPKRTPYCLTKIGYILTLEFEYEEAMKTLEKVFNTDPDSFLAIKGIANTWMRIAKTKAAAKLFGSARDCAQYAVDYILKVLKKQNQFISCWKLLADALIFITKLPNQYSYINIPELSSDSNTTLKRKDKDDIYPLAIACYSHIAKQKQEITSYHIAYAYFLFYNMNKQSRNIQIAYNVATACVKQQPNSGRNWNLLGRICFSIKKYAIAQHCFIKGLNVSRKCKTVELWCNLGTLYLKLKCFKIANYCYWHGQCTSPSYPQSWIGQALIAEAIREEEAMDLFRHASTLGYHPESALGYADWVCQVLKDNKYSEDIELKYSIEDLYAIPNAMDLIQWFCNFDPYNACANNMLGILQECSKQYTAAIKSYERAFRQAEDNNKNEVLMNIGRLLVRLERYEEAVKIYKAINEASFNSTVGLALALFKSGAHQESYSVYDTALHWLCNDDNDKLDVLVAMAAIVYKNKGFDDAKSILFQSIPMVETAKPHALFAMCSLGLMHSEQSLSKLAISELHKFEKDKRYGYDIGLLKSLYHILDDDLDEAIAVISDALYDYPNDSRFWYCMTQYCLRDPDTKAEAAGSCAMKGILCAKLNTASNSHLFQLMALASVVEQMSGSPEKALRHAKEGLHLYPEKAEIWAALLYSLLSDKIWMERKNWLLSAAGYVRRNLDLTTSLTRWLSLLERKLSQ